MPTRHALTQGAGSGARMHASLDLVGRHRKLLPSVPKEVGTPSLRGGKTMGPDRLPALSRFVRHGRPIRFF
ncbi:hypothetical protein BCEP4_180006 [Burkholderia cepacia]|nr:hypothetical protein BCEP4_180006 [Burkholderia cepacia]